ncbi:MAG TPA: hypothetical protein VHF25_05390 [Nitriliruptorales bacterium]|nr:hypothetical protein [Nitriliruptorales bacterium]
MSPRRPRTPSLLIVGLSFVVVACASGESSRGAGGETSPPAPETPPREETVHDLELEELHAAAEHMDVWATGLAAALVEPVDPAGEPHDTAAEFATQLDFLLRHYVVLLGFAGQATVEEQHDALRAAEHALTGVGDELRVLFVEHFDSEVGLRFEEDWSSHTGSLLVISEAIATDVDSARETAQEEIERADATLADLLEDITGGAADPEAIVPALEEHVATVTAVFETQAEEEDWYADLLTALEKAAELAAEVAEPVAETAELAGDVTSEASTLRVELSGRMVDSAFLIGAMTRARLADRSEDFEHAHAVVDENAQLLGETTAAQLGEAAGVRLEELWIRHVDDFIAYAEAVRSEDQPAQEQAMESLADWAAELGELLEQATGGVVDATAQEHEAAQHVDTIRRVIETQARALSG